MEQQLGSFQFSFGLNENWTRVSILLMQAEGWQNEGFGEVWGGGGWFVSLKDVRIHEAPRQARKLCAGELCNFPRRKASTWILPAA